MSTPHILLAVLAIAVAGGIAAFALGLEGSGMLCVILGFLAANRTWDVLDKRESDDS